jgi:hypothetical protein
MSCHLGNASLDQNVPAGTSAVDPALRGVESGAVVRGEDGGWPQGTTPAKEEI